MIRKRRDWRKTLKAQWRDLRVLFNESRNSLIAFVVLNLSGALIFFFLYRFPETQQRPEFMQALHATFALIFFETLLPFPDQWYLQIMFFVVPVVGLAVVADGVLRFGTALTNKQARGQKWQVAMASTYSDHVVVCGFGRVGYRVTLELLKYGREVVAIEPDESNPFLEKGKALGVPIILADARRSEILEKAGVAVADAIIPATDNELANLDIALDAREMNPGIKVVMRMFDPELAKRVEKGFGIHTAFSSSALTAPIFAAAAMRVPVKYSFYVGDTLMNISEIVVQAGSKFSGWTVQQLEHEMDLSVVYYEDGTVDMHPAPGLEMKPGTKLLVMATMEMLHKMDKMNKGK